MFTHAVKLVTKETLGHLLVTQSILTQVICEAFWQLLIANCRKTTIILERCSRFY